MADSSPDDLINPIAAKLVHQSKLQGSEDNITAIVVFLKDVKDILNNADKFISNSSMYYVQNHDFTSMNGNMKILSMDSNSDAAFSKPTVLELNAASSKKLKNAANVMSSAGFGSTSYSYQFVENLDDSSFHSLESSVDSSQTAYMSQAAHSASCFAPEATALSELPTPPIDDMLASQQFDNFCSTDLYKELNNSVEISEQHSESVNKSESLASNIEVSSQFISNTVENTENESLCNIENNSGNLSNSALSPEDAIGIASDVVSTTIETAVKCLAEESAEPIPVQNATKLNPYAKPFVMKSFFNPGESDMMSNSFIGSSIDDALSSGEVDNTKPDNQLFTGIAEENDSNHSIPKNLEKDQLPNVSNEPNTDLINLQPLVPEQSVHSENTSNKLPLDVPSIESENRISEPLSTEMPIENISSDNLLQNISDKDLLCEFQQTNATETYQNQVSSEKYDVSFSKHDVSEPIHDISQLRMDFEKMGVESLKSESDLVEINMCASTVDISHPTDENKLNLHSLSSENETFLSKPLEMESSVEQCVTQFVNSEELISEQNLKLDNISDVSGFDNIVSNISEIESRAENEHNFDIAKNVNDDFQALDKETISTTDIQVDPPQIKELQEMLISESIEQKSEENIMHISNQNSALSNVSDRFGCGINETDIKSKFEEIEKSIVDAVVKSENSESSSFVEPMSLISNIKDELISAESEVPSEPSIEDSRAEPVAVDLKSLPEGIPEAEGVTEDIDSDSEKDGGWSYMKGNIVTGSKPKSEEKTSKITKSNETKSNIATKSKRDVSKTNLDAKSKVKNTVADKTKSTMPDKSKTVSQDKTKNIADKTKNVTSVDKTRTLVSSDKNKRIAVEKKTDIKSKVLKSSVASTTKLASVSNTTRKATSETTGTTTTTVTKPARPTTLLRTSGLSTDKSGLTNKATAKSKVTSLVSENKPAKPNVSSSVKGPIASHTKSSTLSNRATATSSNRTTATSTFSNRTTTSTLSNRTTTTSTLSNRTTTRPAATATSKISTIARTAAQKSVSEPKAKLPSTMSTVRKPLSAPAKKPEVKEVKDTVNKQISARKTTTTSKMESNSTLTNKRVVSCNNKSASAKAPSAAKTDINKRNVPKVASSKPGIKKVDSKVNQDVSENKEKIMESVQAETGETKDNSSAESDKNSTEAAQVVEEKFILETNNKEIPKEMQNNSNEEQIVENGSLMKTVSPDEVITITESNPENLS